MINVSRHIDKLLQKKNVVIILTDIRLYKLLSRFVRQPRVDERFGVSDVVPQHIAVLGKGSGEW